MIDQGCSPVHLHCQVALTTDYPVRGGSAVGHRERRAMTTGDGGLGSLQDRELGWGQVRVQARTEGAGSWWGALGVLVLLLWQPALLPGAGLAQ